MFEEMQMFAAVVENGSINKASQQLNMSQPALSRQMAALEHRLGVSLFTRHSKRLEVTRLGRISYEYALEMNELMKSFQQALLQNNSGSKARLTVGASLTTLQSTLPELLNLLTADYPSADMKAVTGKTHEIVDMVIERKVDIGLVASAIDHPELACISLFDDHLCLVTAIDHPLALSNDEASFADLHHLPMILFSKGTWYRVMTDELFRRYVIQPDVRMEIDSFEAIIRLLSASHTATLLPRSYLRPNYLKDSGLITIHMPELEQTVRTTSLIYAKYDQPNSVVHHLVDKAQLFFAARQQDRTV